MNLRLLRLMNVCDFGDSPKGSWARSTCFRNISATVICLGYYSAILGLFSLPYILLALLLRLS